MPTTHSQKTSCIIPAGSNAGLPRSGCKHGPAELQRYCQKYPLPAEFDWQALSENNSPLQLFKQLATRCQHHITEGIRPIVIGGDHSIAMATWSGVMAAAGAKNLGLLWIDAHFDAHTPATSPSGNLHGMPVAALLGTGLSGDSKDARKLTALYPGKEHLPAGNLAMIAGRSFETEEADFLSQHQVAIYPQHQITQQGMESILQQAAKQLAHCDYLGVSLDLDAIEPKLFPAVSTPAASGLQLNDLVALSRFCRQQNVIAVELCEFNPEHDSNGKSLRLLHRFIGAIARIDPWDLQGLQPA